MEGIKAQSKPPPVKTVMGLPLKFQVLKDVSINGTTFQKFSNCEGSFFEYFDFLRDRPTVDGLFDKKVYSEDDRGFRGGSFEDMLAPVTNFNAYNNSLTHIRSDKLWRQVVTSMADTMQRRRSRCQYDGDFDFDRRWDSQPYQQRTKRPQVTRIVKLNVEAAFSASVSTDVINNYGAFVGALITLLEQSGVLVELKVMDSGQNFTNNDGSNRGFKISLLIKKADEYLPPSQVLKAISANWYRRAIFGLIVASAENLNEDVRESLGSPIYWGRSWERKDNEIFIYSTPDYNAQHDIVKSLTELLGAGPKGEKPK